MPRIDRNCNSVSHSDSVESAEPTDLEDRLSLTEGALARTEAALTRLRRQLHVTWAVTVTACCFVTLVEANPQARAQFGVTLTSLDARLKIVETKTSSMSFVPAADSTNTSGFDTVRFSGVNVQIVDGLGVTEGNSNGLGNLIIGYNELRSTNANLGGTIPADNRTGSHNLITGVYNNYSGYGGAVFGYGNGIAGQESDVTGGLFNVASNTNASISGGYDNSATGLYSSVSGGSENVASGLYSSVSGGNYNIARGAQATVSGGQGNQANGQGAVVSGGAGRTASAQYGWSAGSQAMGGFTPGNFSSP